MLQKEMIVQHLAKQLRHHLLDQGISVNEFAKQQGKTRQTISLYLNGKVSIDSLVEICWMVLGCEITVLVGGRIMLLKLPQELYEAIKQQKGDVSHQTYIISLLKQQLLTKSHGEQHEQATERKETESLS